MCGVAGFISPNHLLRDPVSALSGMSDAMRPRGVSDEGAWFDPNCGVGLAFRRPATNDPGLQAGTQMRSRSGRYAVAFHGRIHNARELRDELRGLGHSFSGDTDSELVLAASEQWGVPRSVERFDGVFAFAAWDGDERRLHLVRDRFGTKPLYWGQLGADGRTTVFCSALKSLRALPLICPEVDSDAAALFLRYGYVPAPLSLLRGIHKLMPAHRVEVDGTTGRHSAHCYWNAEETAEHGAQGLIEDYGDARAEVARRLDEIVRLRAASDGPIGGFLSGDIGSTLVTAIASRGSGARLHTYAIRFDGAEHGSTAHAREVARHLRTDHHELSVSESDAVDLIPAFADAFDEPCTDSSVLPTFLLCRRARGNVTVALSGAGGNELFGGCDRYLHAHRMESVLRRWPLPVRTLASVSLRSMALAPAAVLRLLDIQGPGSSRIDPRERAHELSQLLLMRNPREVHQFLASIIKIPDHYIARERSPRWTAHDHERCLRIGCSLTRSAVRDMIGRLPDGILTGNDRIGMAFDLEVRAPLVDRQLFDLAMRIPARFRFPTGNHKPLLRDLLNGHLPSELVEHPFAGSTPPIDLWLRGDLREWAEHVLDRSRLESQGILDAHTVRDCWRRFQSGDQWRCGELWNCLMLASWIERWSPGKPMSAPSEGDPIVVLHDVQADPSAVLGDRGPAAIEVDESDDAHSASTRRQFSGGAYWGIVQVVAQKGSSFLTYLVAVWMLQPGDVGSVMTAISIATLLSLIFPGAAGDVLMHRQSAVSRWQTACIWLALAAGLLLISICLAASPLLDWQYAGTPVALFTLLAALRIALDGASMVALAKLRLLERFRLIAAVDTSLSVLTLLATLGLCWLELAGWALLLPMVAAAALRFVILVSAASIPLFRPGNLSRAIALWRDFRASGLQHYLNGATQTIDYFAISLFSTKDVLGLYTVAYQLSFTLHALLSYTVAGIAQSVFSRIQQQPERLQRTFVTAQRLTMAVAAPLFIGLAIASPVLVKVLLPERWEHAWVSISILSIAFMFMNPIQISAALLRARGRFAQLLRFQIVQTTFLAAAVFMATGFGAAQHVALAVCLSGVVFGPYSIGIALREIGGAGRAIRDVYLSPLIASVVCLTPQFLLLRAVGDDSWASLAVQVVAGLIGLGLYVVLLRFISPSLYQQVRVLLAEVRNRVNNPLGG